MEVIAVGADYEKTMLAFADWMHGYICSGFTEEGRATCISVVRKFADFIAPAPITDSTVSEIKALEKDAKTNRQLVEREETKAPRNGLLPQFPERILEASAEGPPTYTFKLYRQNLSHLGVAKTEPTAACQTLQFNFAELCMCRCTH